LIFHHKSFSIAPVMEIRPFDFENFKQEVDSKLEKFDAKLNTTQKDVEKLKQNEKELKKDMETMLADQKTSKGLIQEMHGVLVGNDQFGVKGYKQRLEEVESKVEDIKKTSKDDEEDRKEFLGFKFTSRERLFLLVGALLATSGWLDNVLSLFGLG
jgi:phage shock protein A